MKRLAAGLVILLLIAGAGLVVYVYPFSRSSSEPGEQPRAGTGPARILLNEILFQPSPGQSPFVELVNAGGAPAKLDGFSLVNQAGEKYELASGLTVPAGGVLLLRLDGSANPPPSGFIHRETGSLVLYSGAAALDEAWWSTAGGPSFSLGRGGHIPALMTGSTLGRPRGATGRGSRQWSVFDPADSTPGMPNPVPAVTGLMPLSGAVLRASTPRLSWYGVATATRYRVQVATDRSFTSPVFDETIAASGSSITTEQITTSGLSPGRYLWRVQAIFGGADRPSAAFSTPAIFWLEAPTRAARETTWEGWWNRWVAPVHASQTLPASARKVLPVPLILQKKDTYLLGIVPGDGEETGDRSWDRPWQPAPAGPFCARASVAMVTAYFHGSLSQDRISYEAHKNKEAGPLFDITINDGLFDPEIERVLKFALGAESTLRTFDDARTYFDAHKAAINDGYPVVASTPTHAFVVVGWGEDERGKYLIVNDPGVGQYDWLLLPTAEFVGVDSDISGSSTNGRSSSFFLPRGASGKSDEPTISRDTDGDGLRDFDETVRFGTNPGAKDTDGDGVSDKDEIRAWMFDKKYGAALTGYVHPWQHADRDRDNKRMEVDADSDNGGCFDGMEDTNSNGKHDSAQKELSNFDEKDDDCISGSHRLVQDSFWRHPTNGDTQKLDSLTEIQFSLRETGGSHSGRATLTASHRQAITRPNPGECPNWIDSTDPYQYVVEVHANTFQMPDGTVSVSINPPAGWEPPMMRFVNSCPGSQPFEQPGPKPGIGGILRNGVFDERVDMPLDLEGATGTKYYETHIRIGSGRR